jgi:hypothetical protein
MMKRLSATLLALGSLAIPAAAIAEAREKRAQELAKGE